MVRAYVLEPWRVVSSSVHVFTFFGPFCYKQKVASSFFPQVFGLKNPLDLFGAKENSRVWCGSNPLDFSTLCWSKLPEKTKNRVNSKREKVLFQIFPSSVVNWNFSFVVFVFVCFLLLFSSILLDVSFDQKCARMSFSAGTSPPADVECEWA